jgi:hypothetical protein
MANKIRKLNELNNIESFIQINLFKGFTYVDKAGELVNAFYKNTTPPQFSMNLDGLIIVKPDDITEEIKISPIGYWAHYINPSSLDQISTMYLKPYENITKILDVGKITRVGWRNYFVYDYQNLAQREKALDKFSLKTELKIEVSVFTFQLNDISSTITIRKASKNDKKNTPSLLLDIDSFKNFVEPIPEKHGAKELVEIRKMLQSEEFIEKINWILE